MKDDVVTVNLKLNFCLTVVYSETFEQILRHVSVCSDVNFLVLLTKDNLRTCLGTTGTFSGMLARYQEYFWEGGGGLRFVRR